MNKQQIIHHVAKRLEFLLNHSDGADRIRNQDKITELTTLLSEITTEDELLESRGNSFSYADTLPSSTLGTLGNGVVSGYAAS